MQANYLPVGSKFQGRDCPLVQMWDTELRLNVRGRMGKAIAEVKRPEEVRIRSQAKHPFAPLDRECEVRI